MAAQTPPTTEHFNSALPSSDAPCRPNSRFKPASGLKRVKFGAMACGLKFQPPSTTEASNTRPIRVPKTGNSTVSALMQASPSALSMLSGSRRLSGSTASERRIICDRRPARELPIAISAALPPIMVAKLVSSRERGTCPRSRASCSRFCEGSSVRSPPCSASAAINELPRRVCR
jgi:hypothetical protein